MQTNLIRSIPALLGDHAANRGRKPAFCDAGRSVTYSDLERSTSNLAGHLAASGVEPGDAVALYLPNSVLWVESCLAILRAGGVVVPVSHDATPDEVAYRLADSGSKAVIATAGRKSLLDSISRSGSVAGLRIFAGDPAGDAGGLGLERLLRTSPVRAASAPEDLHATSFIVYTSGTTGRAKGVLLSLHSMLWVAAACWAPIAGLAQSDHVLSPLPLYHSYAVNLSVLGVLAVGASEYIMEKYSTAETLRLLAGSAFTVFPGVPTMFHYLLHAAEGLMIDTSPLRLCISAGAVMPATLNAGFEARFGVPLVDGYGITETSTMVTMNGPSWSRVMGSCGMPLPGVATRIVDPETREDLAPHHEGELIVRGPNLMKGYHRKPDETSAALHRGWYRTGDLARSDENGFLTITGRLKELIIRGGQNIAPAEIEEVAATADGVLDCAVIGAAHEQLGEVPVLFVVGHDGAAIDRDAIIDHCRTHLSYYKIPVAIREIDAIPRTGSGKVMRFKLAERLPDLSPSACG